MQEVRIAYRDGDFDLVRSSINPVRLSLIVAGQGRTSYFQVTDGLAVTYVPFDVVKSATWYERADVDPPTADAQ